jgi:TM2 domain-containing membrane protein YozV
MKSTGIAYLLCCLGFLGIGGIHRFYLGKYVTGVLYFLTGGFLYIGTIIDLFRIPGMVEHENLKWQLRQGATVNINIHGQPGQQISVERQYSSQSYQPIRDQTPSRESQPPLDPEKTLENTILKLARQFRGKLTPLELAANSSLSLDEADKSLENIVRKGYANMTVTDEGNIIYEFPGFLHFESSDSRELKDQNE